MKKLNIIFTIIIGIFNSTINAQEQVTIANFEIRDGRINGEDITPQLVEENSYLVFYKASVDDDEILLANFWEKTNSQSSGPIYAIVKEVYLESESEYKGELYNFYWSYHNSYDDKKGTAKVKLWLIYKPQGTYFEFTIIPEDLDELVYKGVMKGDLSLLENYIKK